MNMKTLALCICSIALAITASAQPPPPQPPAAPSPALSASATASVSPGSNLADKLHQKLDKKLHGKHGIVIDGDDVDLDKIKSDDIPEFVIPIVAITMLTIFGAPEIVSIVMATIGITNSGMSSDLILSRSTSSPSITIPCLPCNFLSSF